MVLVVLVGFAVPMTSMVVVLEREGTVAVQRELAWEAEAMAE